MIKFRPVALALLVPLLLAGCGTASPTQRTVVVTSTAPVPESGQAPATVPDQSTVVGTAVTTDSATQPSDGASVTAGGTSDPPGTDATAAGSTAAESTGAESAFAGPFVAVDPLKQDCAKVLNATTISTSLGADQAGDSSVIVDVANPGRKTTGRIKCLYGVTPERSSGAVTVLLTQYEDATAAAEQVATTVGSETQQGAKASVASVKGIPAEVLLRDGGLIVVVYDTWTLSVVVADGVAEEAALPAALSAMADYSLTQLVGA